MARTGKVAARTETLRRKDERKRKYSPSVPVSQTIR